MAYFATIYYGTHGRTWDTRTDMGHTDGHGIQIRTWDTNPDMGYKSGHLLSEHKSGHLLSEHKSGHLLIKIVLRFTL